MSLIRRHRAVWVFRGCLCVCSPAVSAGQDGAPMRRCPVKAPRRPVEPLYGAGRLCTGSIKTPLRGFKRVLRVYTIFLYACGCLCQKKTAQGRNAFIALPARLSMLYEVLMRSAHGFAGFYLSPVTVAPSFWGTGLFTRKLHTGLKQSLRRCALCTAPGPEA